MQTAPGTTLTPLAQYELALGTAHTSIDGWRRLARLLDRTADGAWSLPERLRFRGLADDCRWRADRLEQRGARDGESLVDAARRVLGEAGCNGGEG